MQPFKKLTSTAKILIILSVLLAIFFSLAVTSSVLSVDRTVRAIEEIGEVEYSDEAGDKIDKANFYYDSLDKNIGLEKRIHNAQKLFNAKTEYVRLAVKRAYLADKQGMDEETVKEFTADAREAFKRYFKDGEEEGISNYGDLIYLENKFGVKEQPPQQPSPPSDGGDIELCRKNLSSDGTAHTQDYFASEYTYLKSGSVFKTLTWEKAVYLFQSEGNYLIMFGGSWCANTQAVVDYIDSAAKSAGVTAIYNLDFRLDGYNASSHIRESNGSGRAGANYNYLYGELVSRYLTNIDDWIEYTSASANALTYTNSDGEEVSVGKAQVPFLFIYNKDNTVNYAGDSADGIKYPVVRGYERMLYRKDGTDELYADRKVQDETTRVYGYAESLNRNIFSHITENGVNISEFSDEDYIRKSYNQKTGYELIAEEEKINIVTVTYRQLERLLENGEKHLILFGGSWCGNTRAVIKIINAYAVENGFNVYNFDTKLDGGYAKAYWGYSKDLHIRDNASEYVHMYGNLLTRYLQGIQTEYKVDDGNPNHNIVYTDGANAKVTVNKLQVPYFFYYDKYFVDENGHDSPVTAYTEKMFSLDESREDFICKKENYTEYITSAFKVIKAYADGVGAEATDILGAEAEPARKTVKGYRLSSSDIGRIVAASVGVATVTAVLAAVYFTKKKKKSK